MIKLKSLFLWNAFLLLINRLFQKIKTSIFIIYKEKRKKLFRLPFLLHNIFFGIFLVFVYLFQTYFHICCYHILSLYFFTCWIIFYIYILLALAIFLCYFHSIVLFAQIVFLHFFDNKYSFFYILKNVYNNPLYFIKLEFFNMLIASSLLLYQKRILKSLPVTETIAMTNITLFWCICLININSFWRVYAIIF